MIILINNELPAIIFRNYAFLKYEFYGKKKSVCIFISRNYFNLHHIIFKIVCYA